MVGGTVWTPSTYGGIPDYKYGHSYDWGRIEFKYSTDGIIWPLYNKPLVISDIMSNTFPPADSVCSYGVNLQTGENGEVYAVWAIYHSDPIGIKNSISDPPYGAEFALGFAKSINGGVSFDSAHAIINNIQGIHYNVPFIHAHKYNPYSFPTMCVDHSIVHPGRIYVAYSNLTTSGTNTAIADIYVFHSDDNGHNWSIPVQITSSLGDYVNYKFSISPWITCDNETGKVCVIFYDDRNYSLDGESQFDVYVSMSQDGGATWEESSSRVNSNLGFNGGINDTSFCSGVVSSTLDFFSDYNGITVKDGLAYPIWTTNSMVYTSDSTSHSYLTTSPYYIWNCISDTVLSDYTLTTSDVKKFECERYISTYDSVIVDDNAFSFFDAGDSITLHPGFHAENGSFFHAYIDGCVPFDGTKAFYKYCSGASWNNDNNIYKSYLYDNLIKVYPNPTSGNLTISLGEFQGTNVRLILMNAYGESIIEMTPSSQTSYSLDISNYQKGIYFIKLFTDDRTYVSKIIYE
jgi:hypothetical protein